MALQVHVVNVQHEPIIYGEYVTSAMIDELNNSLMAKSAVCSTRRRRCSRPVG